MGVRTAALVCPEGAVLSVLKWIVRGFKEIGSIRQFDSPTSLERAVDWETIDVLLLDADALTESPSQFLGDLRDRKPNVKTILIISPTSKDEIMEIIEASLAKGIVVKPFTKEAVSRYLEKLV
jgi:DNA-binding NtrC family response regulator